MSYERKPVRRWRKAARNAVRSALRNGTMTPQPCAFASEVCHGKVTAHHHSYARERWLDVTWMCRYHHAQQHRALKLLEPVLPPAR